MPLVCALLAVVMAMVPIDNERANALGVKLDKKDRFDVWLGYKGDADLKPDPKLDGAGLVRLTLQQMSVSQDGCQQIAAKLIVADGLKVDFVPFAGEGAYSEEHRTILINKDAAYLKHPSNLALRLVHESFHRAQYAMKIVQSAADAHRYEHRPLIIKYLQERFGGTCALNEVPEAVRNQVPDSVEIRAAPTRNRIDPDAVRRRVKGVRPDWGDPDFQGQH